MPVAKKWLKITLACPVEMSEAVSDILGVISGSGVEIHPLPGKKLDEISAFFPFEDTAGAPRVKTIAGLREKVAGELTGLFSVYGVPLPETATAVLEEEDWATSWQQYYTAFEIAPGLVIKPSWETYSPTANQHVLEMDPGMAFGTGQHESTRLALALISFCFGHSRDRIKTALDVGTGTGILAMAAALFGAGHVVAVDNDPTAVAVAKDNIRRNNLAAAVTVSGTPLADVRGQFDLICANIVHDVLVEMAPQFKRLVAPGGHVVLAGLLAGAQVRSITGIYARFGLQSTTTREEGDWAALLLRSVPPTP